MSHVLISLQITSSSSHSSCTYPDHGVAVCKLGNPCGFTCTDGFTPSPASHPTTCACKSPNTVCNGVCGKFKACSSKRAVANDLEGLLVREPELFGRVAGEKRETSGIDGIVKKERRNAVGRRLGERLGCRTGWEACGVFGGSRTAWECVDTMNDLESCTSLHLHNLAYRQILILYISQSIGGGCTIPLTLPSAPLTLDDMLTFGVDCTSLPGVRDVSCTRGVCAVRRCERGWVVSRDGQRCHRESTGLQDIDAAKNFEEEATEFDSAESWGLEHVPLGGETRR